MTVLVSVEGLVAGYGDAKVVEDIAFELRAGEVVTLMGRNGMGKTTTVKALFGLIRPMAGRILIAGADRAGAPPHVIARLGLGLVPEGRRVFANLTVEENLIATARPPRDPRGPGWTLERVTALFPRLAERRRNRGTQLSGGEQQMLAIGRALMTNPTLLVLDEATEGLAPVIRDEIWSCLATLKAEGQSILVIDKTIDALARLATRHIVIEKGRIVWTGTAAAFTAERATVEGYLHV